MTQEQKAKAYDEAIKKAKDMLSYKEVRQEDIEYLFPELKESEDESIRKVLVELIKCNERCGYFMINNITTSAMLAWLEKQGEQKSIDKLTQQEATAPGIHKVTEWTDIKL